MLLEEDPTKSRKVAKNGFQLDMNQMHPVSRGWVKLKSTDPTDHPLIDPCYLTDDRDRRELIDAGAVGAGYR